MFVSIKWKAVIFLSLVLFLISLAWVTQSIYQNIENYRAGIEQNQKRHQQILDQLITDNYLKLSEYAQLIVDNPQIKSKKITENSHSIKQYLQDKWFAWNLNIGIDYVAILSVNKEFLGEAHQFQNEETIQSLHNSLRLFVSQVKNQPQTFVFCSDSCQQLVMESFVFEDGSLGIIILGQNMADVISRYHAVSSSDVAVIIDNKDKNRVNDGHFLDSWNAHIWAMTNFDQMFPVLKDFSKQHDIHAIRDVSLWNAWSNNYSIQKMIPSNYVQVGSTAYYMNIANESKRQELLKLEIMNEVFTSLVGWFVAELFLIFVMLGPIKRLLRIVQALELLPKHEYSAAANLVKSSKSYIRDELTQLEDSTLYLSNELDSLHNKVEVSKEELNSKIMMLTRSKAFLQRLFDNANLYILTQSYEFETISHNNLFVHDLLTKQQNSFLDLFISSYDRKLFIDGLEELQEGLVDSFQQEVNMHTNQGDTRTLAWTHTLVKDDSGYDQVLSIGMDVTQRKKDELALHWLANNDSLTKIGNRRAFNKNLEEILAREKSGAIVFIDVNRFKQINDIYGHLVGDKVLVDIAEQLKKHTRENDSISRLAGDEFTIVLPGVTEEKLPHVLSNLSDQLSRTIELSDDRQVEYSVSLGGALFPEHGTDEQSLIVHSDMAMYKAKKKGLKNWHIFDYADDQLNDLKAEHDLMELLKQALQNDLFLLVFQPILTIVNHRVSHYEVLLRLKSVNDEWISPAEFITVAERVGLIREIDFWVIKSVFKFMQAALTEQPDLKFAINVSAPSLQEQLFSKNFIQLMDEYSISSQNLIVELTETAYIDNFVQVLKNLKELNEIGVSIALDDFGVGYSSFSYLKELPLTYVKLDGSYIQNIHNLPQNQAFIKSVVIMTKAFGMQTIAEFVEDQDVLDKLVELEVDFAQGYYIGKPHVDLLTKKQLLDLQKPV
ncbi:putative bifunctional diguanylate cyclase/phosphodiesterase [Thiomicrorhabdus lithotrophica]|uniref:EAL domain-containing protein n=1 Tax=Thiomicrorhabdus lithotrophica TaxID=2949997 RepID=A0ABY8C8K6_9GAMM|nr:bifunctional diguanylate cyclase/phosphodiesterase [Thiomicrorhabdus lithotrophica]WEJ62290.1 EAL domain-containing protein [Thiomicrorhabdus lithotrophica]